MDEALLRPGRFEVQLEVTLPDAQGRADIMAIHLRGLREQGRLQDGCHEWACMAAQAREREGWSGAEIAGVVRAAAGRAVQRSIDANAEEARRQEAGSDGRLGASDAADAERNFRGVGLDVHVTRDDVAAAFDEVDAGRGHSARKTLNLTRRFASVFSH